MYLNSAESNKTLDSAENKNNYFLPSGQNYIINLSGGRSSGFMLYKILEAHNGQLPDYVKVVFCNTGKEYNETLKFVRDIEKNWKVPVVWLEFTCRAWKKGGKGKGGINQKYWFKEVGYWTASRNGRPFEQIISAAKMLPSLHRRFCTRELKIKTVKRWARVVLNWPKYRSVLGIRHDEPARWGKGIFEECSAVFPMAEAGHTVEDVLKFWSNNSFDLKLRQIQSNCDLCYLKGPRKLKILLNKEPRRAVWWSRQESRVHSLSSATRRKRKFSFRSDYSYKEMLKLDKSRVEDLDDTDLDCFCSN